MQNIIKITKHEIGTENINSVNAREIHEYFEVKTRFDTWIQRAIAKYDFLENVDYIVMLKNEHNSNGGRKPKDYIVTLDMAKELAMLENNPKGKETRKYFISCEKQLIENSSDGFQSLMMEMMKTNQQMIQNQENTLKAIVNMSNDVNRTKSKVNTLENEFYEMKQSVQEVTIKAPKGGIKKFLQVSIENMDLKTELEELRGQLDEK